MDAAELEISNQKYLFYSMHSSSLSKHSAYATHNVTQLPTVRSEMCVKLIVANVSSSRDEEQATGLLSALPPNSTPLDIFHFQHFFY